MEWSGRWTVCLLCLLAMTTHGSPLTSVGSDTAKQREKRSTAISDETPWSPDYDNEVTSVALLRQSTWKIWVSTCKPELASPSYIDIINLPDAVTPDEAYD